MEMRNSTKNNYKKFLETILSEQLSDIPTKVKEFSIDAKMIGFLKSRKYANMEHDGLYTTNFHASDIDEIVMEFGNYREELNRKSDEAAKDLKYYQTNKEFLVDVRNQNAISATLAEKIKKETRDSLIEEVIKYTEIAVQLGKKDIAGFVKLLISAK